MYKLIITELFKIWGRDMVPCKLVEHGSIPMLCGISTMLDEYVVTGSGMHIPFDNIAKLSVFKDNSVEIIFED